MSTAKRRPSPGHGTRVLGPANAPQPLLYSGYINDRAIVESLGLGPVPAGVNAADWPVTPADWAPGDDWPTSRNWAHDEVLFIRTHQAFEVWFALVLHELGAVVRDATRALGRRALPRVDLADREPAALPTGSAAPTPPAGAGHHRPSTPPASGLAPRDWPKTAAVIARVARADPAAGRALALLGQPGRNGLDVALAQGSGETESFNRQLVLWTHRLKRSAAALLCTVPFFDVLATMTPREFLEFRDRLQPASGFGSVQFRELELLLGLRELNQKKIRPDGGVPTDADGSALPKGMLRPTDATPGPQRTTSVHAAQPPWGWARVARRWREPSLRDVVYGLLNAAWAAGSRERGPEAGLPDLRRPAVDRFVALNLQKLIDDSYRGLPARRLDERGAAMMAHGVSALDAALSHRETLTASLIAMHPAQERFAQFLNACLDLDSALLRWRDRHIRFVEAQIGLRRGTGGGGIAYLRTTTAAERPAFFTHALPCLWQSRSFVQPDA